MIENSNNNQLAEDIALSANPAKSQPELTQSQSVSSAPNTPPSLRSLTQFVYFCQGLSFFFGLTAIVGVCINYLKRDAVKSTVLSQKYFSIQHMVCNHIICIPYVVVSKKFATEPEATDFF